LQAARKKVEGAMVDLDGEWYYRIDNYESMEDFFMTIVSPSDHWMYLSSNGSLSAGRDQPQQCFFPLLYRG
jgi:glucan-binding YG repeat protein